jgi:hypothetical protein
MGRSFLFRWNRKEAQNSLARASQDVSKLRGKKWLEIIDIDLEGASAFTKDATLVFLKRFHPFASALKRDQFQCFLKHALPKGG